MQILDRLFPNRTGRGHAEEVEPRGAEEAPLAQDPPLAQPASLAEAPATEHAAPVAQEEALLAREEAPLAHEQAPLVQEQSPLAHEQAPLAQEQASLVQEQSPLIQEARRAQEQIEARLAEIMLWLRNIRAEGHNSLGTLSNAVANVREESNNRLAHLERLVNILTGAVANVGPAAAGERALATPPTDDIFALDYALTVGGSLLHVERLCSDIAAFSRGQLGEKDQFLLAERLAFAAYPTYKFSEFNRLHLKDRAFIETYKETMDPANWHSLDRKYLVNEMLKCVSHLPGDFVECGVWKSATAVWLARAAQAQGRHVHLFDSWEGLSTPEPAVDGTHWIKGSLAVDMASATKYLESYKCCSFYKGWIPERFDEVKDIKVCFLHIDVDLHDPTRHSLAFFYERMVPGGIIICDDYGAEPCPGAKKAVDDFLGSRPERVALLPTGQGLIIKQ